MFDRRRKFSRFFKLYSEKRKFTQKSAEREEKEREWRRRRKDISKISIVLVKDFETRASIFGPMTNPYIRSHLIIQY